MNNQHLILNFVTSFFIDLIYSNCYMLDLLSCLQLLSISSYQIATNNKKINLLCAEASDLDAKDSLCFQFFSLPSVLHELHQQKVLERFSRAEKVG